MRIPPEAHTAWLALAEAITRASARPVCESDPDLWFSDSVSDRKHADNAEKTKGSKEPFVFDAKSEGRNQHTGGKGSKEPLPDAPKTERSAPAITDAAAPLLHPCAAYADAAGDHFSADALKRAARKIGVHSRDETGYDKEARKPWRKSFWSLAPKSGAPSITAPTAPTGEGSHTPTTPISAGQGKSVQSVQSGVCAPTVVSGAPTCETPYTLPGADGPAPSRCACGRPLITPLDKAEGVCVTCDQGAAS